MSDIGELKVKITGDTTSLTSEVGNASGSLKDFGKTSDDTKNKIQRNSQISEEAMKKMAVGASMAVAAAAAAFVKLVSSTLTAADEQVKLARQLNMTNEELAVLTRAGDLAGVSVTEISTASRLLDTELGKATKGIEGAAQKFASLGLSVEELNKMSTEERMRVIGQAIGNMGTHAEKTAAATELFGRNGQKMLNLLDGAEDTFARAASEVGKFGLAISEIDGKRIEQINDNISTLQAASKGAALSIVTSMAPALEQVTAMMTGQSTLANTTEKLVMTSREYNAVVLKLAQDGDKLNETERQTLENRKELLGLELQQAMRGLVLEQERVNNELRKQQRIFDEAEGHLNRLYPLIANAEVGIEGLRQNIVMREKQRAGALEVINTLTSQQLSSMQSIAEAVYDGMLNIEQYKNQHAELYNQIMNIVSGIGDQRQQQAQLDAERKASAEAEAEAARRRQAEADAQAERDAQAAALIMGRKQALEQYNMAVDINNKQLADGFITESEHRQNLISATQKHAEELYNLGYTAKDAGSIGGQALQEMLNILREMNVEVADDDGLSGALDALRARFMSEQEVIKAEYENRRALIAELNAAGMLDTDEYYSLTEQNEAEHQARMTEIQEREAQRRRDLMNAGFGMMSRNLVSIYSNLGSVMEKDEKKLFEIRKNAATATAIIDGISSVQSSYKAGSAIGGPPVGAAFAAVAAAATMANVMAIRSQTYGGGGSITAPSAPSAPSAPAESRPTSTMMVNLQGDFFSGDMVRGLMDKIAEAQADGYKVVMA